MSLNRILSQRPDVAWKEINGETILMDLGVEKKVHRLNSVGSFIWSNINGTQSINEILIRLCHEFDVSESVAKQDLLTLVDELESLGVVNGS